ncbi:winged helix-turn-helix domain-containing protein [Pseudactinotalea sp. Z1739]|uniref:winged helix-turn-helix domain-containing protein n=1 Tax=Pseudactinotalea sp. Z1739 TaxID=3413028 RepID=UPI003C7D446D
MVAAHVAPDPATDRATEVRYLDTLRTWQRQGQVNSVSFLDPGLDCEAPIIKDLRGIGLAVAVHAEPHRALLACGRDQPDVLVLSTAVPTAEAIGAVSAIRDELGTPVLLALGTDETEAASPIIFAGARPILEHPYRLASVLTALAGIEGSTRTTRPLELGPLWLDPAAIEAQVHGRVVRLSLREFRLLYALAGRADEVIGTADLISIVGPGRGGVPVALTPMVKRVREKLVRAGVDPVENVRGLGYRLAVARLSSAP